MFYTQCQVWIYNQVADMRKGIDGLSQLVSDEMEENPSSGGVFVFCNRKRDKIKVLYWQELPAKGMQINNMKFTNSHPG
jgi:transposase